MQPSLMINETLVQFKSAIFNSINIKEINLHGAFSFPFYFFSFASKIDACNKKWCLLYVKILI